jgi:hypothetical protein
MLSAPRRTLTFRSIMVPALVQVASEGTQRTLLTRRVVPQAATQCEVVLDQRDHVIGHDFTSGLASATIRCAHSCNSFGYSLGAGMRPPFRGIRPSAKPRVVQFGDRGGGTLCGQGAKSS